MHLVKRILLIIGILTLVSSVSFCQQSNEPVKRIAAITSVYYTASHADVLITRFLEGFPTDEQLIKPKVKIVSLYIEQFPGSDIGKGIANKFGIPLYSSIRDALTCGTNKLAVDGVLYIGEHGNFGINKYDEKLYPHLNYMDQIYRILDEFNSKIPVYCDKQLGYSWLDSKWIYDRANDLGSPLMAGSSLPFAWQSTKVNIPKNSKIPEAAAVGYFTLDSYGYHVIELLQYIMERRKGGETGVKSVQTFKGEGVYEAARKGLFSMDLVQSACNMIKAKKLGTMKENAKNPQAVVINYNDGSRGVALVMDDYYTEGWAFAAKVDGKIQATEVILPHAPYNHFSYLGLTIQEMFITGKAQIPVERTLYASGILDIALRSLFNGSKLIKTPYLNIKYKPYPFEPIRPTLLEPKPTPKEWSSVQEHAR